MLKMIETVESFHRAFNFFGVLRNEKWWLNIKFSPINLDHHFNVFLLTIIIIQSVILPDLIILQFKKILALRSQKYSNFIAYLSDNASFY